MKARSSMKALPCEWVQMPLAKVGRWFGGGTPSKSNLSFWTNGTIPWVSPKDMKTHRITDAQDWITKQAVSESATNLVPSGSVLVVTRSGILQHTLPVAVTEREVALNQDLKAVTPFENVSPEYLAMGLRAFARDILHSCAKAGTTVQSLDHPLFLRFEIPVPPVPKQRRIVAEIEKQFTRLEAGIAALRTVQAKLKRYRAAVLQAACEGRLVPGTEGKRVSVGDVVDSMKNGIYKPRSAYADEGLACLRMYNIDEGRIVWRDIKRMILAEDEVREYELLPGDLLVNRVNSRELVGKTAAIPEDLERCVFESKNIRVRLNRNVAEPRYVGYAFSVYGQNHFNRNAQQVVGMASISQPQVAGLQFQLPPLAEQRRIVAEVERRLSVVEELESVVSSNLQRANRLRQSILQKAFTGELV